MKDQIQLLLDSGEFCSAILLLNELQGSDRLYEIQSQKIAIFRQWDLANNSIPGVNLQLLETLDSCIEASTENVELRLLRGCILARTMSENSRASEDLCFVLKTNPNYLLALKTLALIALDESDLSAALNYSQRVIGLSQNDSDACSIHAKVLTQLGELEMALVFAQAAATSEPSAYHYNSLGKLLLKLERFDEAEEGFRNAIRFESNASNHRDLGSVLIELKRFREALDELNLAKSLIDSSNYFAKSELMTIEHLIRKVRTKHDPQLAGQATSAKNAKSLRHKDAKNGIGKPERSSSWSTDDRQI